MASRQEVWQRAAQRPGLTDSAVHVWRASLNQGASTVRALFDTLTPDERERAARFHFRKDREHFIVARGVLRDILGGYLDTPPALIRFSYNQYGKPALAQAGDAEALRFNLSHAHEVALYAFARGRDLGLDVEFMRDDFASLEIAERFFSPDEVSTLRAQPAARQTLAFFNCWTRKEAFIKALGEGLSHPLDRFSVSLVPGEPAALLSTADDRHEAARWSLVELAPGAGYVAALALRGAAPELSCWDWHDQIR
ncbi:MAG TPA: 4'-phosphopantetheinyl transferase superfamily protein [Pyrinomonadaceae bacterium]|nr:4'-phosphopantetheinyl transferase superfamily protein [Pyrinomonadaceae bacterium]